jgi:hypothetical protein
MGMKVAAAGGASSVRAKHTRLALSKALNVTINRAPIQASLRKMLKKVKGAKDHGDLLQGFFNDGDDDGASGASGSGDAAAENTKADEALAQVILGVCEDTEVRELLLLLLWSLCPHHMRFLRLLYVCVVYGC